ncbi:MAG: type IX secretion system protein PorQ [Phaeodactylibacter sp.]|nr:type IX secretion system protein PorQ [Phaeodactylibacter sp.]MCB9272737.1 type IX secretion system protein PorQ [Lewinellaceae bacterium]
MYKILLSLALSFLLSLAVRAQIGGINTYEFLNLSPSARVTALGGTLITVRDDDASLAAANPAVLNGMMHQQLAFNHSFHVAGISHGFASYAHHFQQSGITGHAGVQYVSYGTFDQTDEYGQVNGSFKAAEYAITVGAAHQFYSRLALGANLKFITSQLEGYSSLGMATDLAGIYFDTARNFTATAVFRNIGAQLTTYEGSSTEPIPFEMLVGVSKRLRYLPFRFSITYRYFNRWNILYDDPNAEPSTLFFGEVDTERSKTSIWLDNFFRHFVFSGEFLFGRRENFRLRVGYNHFMRKELSVDNFGSLAGFSLGGGIKVNRFRIDYGHTTFHLAGGLNHFSISTGLQEFKK